MLGELKGLLRGAGSEPLAMLQAAIEAQRLPASYAAALSPEAAAGWARCPVAGAAWLLAIDRFKPGARARTCILVFGAAMLSFYLSPLTIMALGAAAGYVWPERR